jgi:hypothetical protein
MSVIGLDLGHATTAQAEHWLADLPPVPGLVACTHFALGRVLITVDGGPAGLPATDSEAVRAVIAQHQAKSDGRAVRYPGVDKLVGALTVEQVLALSAIEEVTTIGSAGVQPTPDTVVDTRDFVRPVWRDGRLTLITTPAPGGRIAPFEVPNPTPCCADHA